MQSQVFREVSMARDMTVAEYFTYICPNRRIHNALVRGRVTTMEQVCAMSEQELLRIRNFGGKALAIVLTERQKYLAGIR